MCDDDGKRQERNRGRNGRIKVQGLEVNFAPVPLPPSMLLFGSARPALVMLRRRLRIS